MMNIGKRSRLSLCQLLLELGYDEMLLLLSKYEFDANELEGHYRDVTKGEAVRNAMLRAEASPVSELVQELADRIHDGAGFGMAEVA